MGSKGQDTHTHGNKLQEAVSGTGRPLSIILKGRIHTHTMCVRVVMSELFYLLTIRNGEALLKGRIHTHTARRKVFIPGRKGQ